MHVVYIYTYTDIPRWHRWTCSKKETPKQISLHKMICTLPPVPSTTSSSLQRVCYCIDFFYVSTVYVCTVRTLLRLFMCMHVCMNVCQVVEHRLDVIFQKLHEAGRVQQRLRLLEEICLVRRYATYELVKVATVIRFDYQYLPLYVYIKLSNVLTLCTPYISYLYALPNIHSHIHACKHKLKSVRTVHTYYTVDTYKIIDAIAYPLQ